MSEARQDQPSGGDRYTADREWTAEAPFGNGLELLEIYDGRIEPAVRGDAACVSALNPNGAAQAYFRIDRPHLLTNCEVEIAIQLFADFEDDIRIEYDSTDRSVEVVPNAPGAFKCGEARKLAQTGAWEQLRFTVSDGRFRGAVNGADFRIVCARPRGTPLFLRSARIRTLTRSDRSPRQAGIHDIDFSFPDVAEPEVSIIIPVWNQLDVSLECLRALRAHTEGSYEVVVVDNGSIDATAAAMKSIPGMRLVSHASNLGFARGCNAGVAVTRGRYVVFLNNDTVPRPGWLSAMTTAITDDSRIGIVGSKLLYPGTGEIQHAGMAFTREGVPYHPFRFQEPETPEVDADRIVPAVTGACLLTSRRIFEQYGGFDERFSNGYEDLDFCLRVREAGYLVLYRASSVLVHHEATTPGRFSQENANLALFLQRWRGRLAADPLADGGLVRAPGVR